MWMFENHDVEWWCYCSLQETWVKN